MSTLGSLYLLVLWGIHFAIMSSQIDTKSVFIAYLEWIPTSKSIQKYFNGHSKIFALGMVIYNCLLQQIIHFEFGFELEVGPLWCHNHLVTRVMHV